MSPAEWCPLHKLLDTSAVMPNAINFDLFLSLSNDNYDDNSMQAHTHTHSPAIPTTAIALKASTEAVL